MYLFDDIKDNSIIVCELNYKQYLLKSFSDKKMLINIKFLTLDELYKNYFFSYNEETIYYIMKNYSYNYEFALDILNNLKYIEDKNYNNTNLSLLKNIKTDLLKNNKLIFNKYFIDYIKEKDIFFCGYDYIDKFTQNLINDIRKISNVTILEKKYTSYKHTVNEFKTIEDEVDFVASSICKLINNNVDINNIKLISLSTEYNIILKRIFSFYNIPIKLNEQNYIYSSVIGKDFINHLNLGILKATQYIQDKYKNNIVRQIVSIVNKYYYLGDDVTVHKLIIHDLQNTNIEENELENKVEVINNYESFDENTYIFTLGFTSQNYPITVQNSGLISDVERKILNIESQMELNKIYKENLIKSISSIKNLTISYSLFNNKNVCYPSNLINEMNLEVLKPSINLLYSNKYNKLKTAAMLDEYYKYNIIDTNLSLLHANYYVPYLEYNNKYTNIDLDLYTNYLKDKNINLSYSSIDTYNKCSFSYYLKNILKLDDFQNNLSSIIGTILHDILDNYYKTGKVDYSLDDNILKYNLNKKEIYYVNKLVTNFKEIFPNIINQSNNMKFNEFKTEDKIEIKLNDKFNLIGFIDKIMIYDNNLSKYAVVVDYKTYDNYLDLSLLKYGINIQLPIYYYLIKNKYKDLNIIGLYYQNILPYDMKYDKDQNYKNRIKDNIKLNGITTDDTLLIELIDKDYYNSSVIKGMKIKNDGNFYSTSKVISNENLDNMYNLVESKIKENLEDILNAKFDINPKIYKEKNISCEYCKYKDICYKTYNDTIIIEEGEDND